MGFPPPRDAAAPFFAFLLRSMPYVWGFGLGVAFAGTVLGWDFVTGDPLVVRQVAGDNAAGLAAFRAYVNDGWGWPLLAAPGFGDAGVNVAFSDSIPVLAVAAKLARPLGVSAESWWGGWFAFVYALQGVGAVFAVRSWGARSVAAQLVAPVLALSMPVLLLQTVHPSLSAHGLVLIGWGLAGRTRTAAGGGKAARLPLVGFVVATLAALAVHPYLAVMVGAIAFGAVADSVVRGRRSVASAAAWFGGLLALAAAWGAVGGYLGSAGPSEGGYGQYATSIAGPFLPTLSSLLADEPTGFVIEPSHPGYAYLGLGVAGLVVVGAVAERRRLVAIGRANQLLVLAVVVLVMWAISPWVRFATGDSFDLPAALAFRLGSPRRAGLLVSGASLSGAAVLAMGVWRVRERHRRRVLGGSALGGFAPALGAVAALAVAASLTGLVAPDAIGVAMSQFRASGRFAWPALYGALVFAVVAIDPARLARSLPHERSTAPGGRGSWPVMASVGLLGALAAVQLADTATLRRFASELLVPGGAERRDFVDALIDLVEAHDRVALGPDFRCTYYPDGVGAFIDVTGAASAAGRPIDRVYSARRPQVEPCSVPQDVDLSDPGVLTVLVEPVAVLTEANVGEDVAERCRQHATLNVCSHRWEEVPPDVLAYFGPVAD